MKKPKKKVARLPFPTQNQKKQDTLAKLDELQAKIDKHTNDIQAISKNHDWQISLLGNFATHDLKNYIHSIDGIVSTYSADEITEEQLDSIRYNIGLMREALFNFSKLVIHNDKSICRFDDIIQAIQILNRDSFSENSIAFTVNNQSEYDIVFKIPFISMLQLLNNLVINATKALEKTHNKTIEILAYLNNNHLTMSIKDNGEKIDEITQGKLFDHGFSTTGGTGIGLYHARYLCEMYKGSINYYQHDSDPYKGFIIILPLLKADET
jgi:signal transduction histidine kinase